MGLLFRNALKGLKKKKVQMLGIILMVFLSTAIYTSMNSALDRLENRYYSYLDEQNVEDFSFVPVVDYTKDISLEKLNELEQNELSNLEENEKQIINVYKTCLLNQSSICNQNLYMGVQGIFEKYGAVYKISNEKIDSIAEKYDFTYSLEPSKYISDEKYLISAMPYNKDKKINKTYLVEGEFPTKDNEITILPNFAKKNDLEIGDDYKIGNTTYKIVGFTYAPDYIYPMVSFSMPIFDEKYNNVVFMNQNTYDALEGVKQDVYVAKFNYKTDPKDRMNIQITTSEDNQNEVTTGNPANEIFKNEKDILTMSMTSGSRIMRIDMLQMEFDTNRKFAEYFLYLLLGISVFIIVVVSKKRIDDEKLQIGVLKSLGYKSSSIAFSYLVYPIVGSLVGGTLGFFLGYILNGPLTSLYMNYFTVPLSSLTFNMKYLLSSIFIPMVALSILSYFIAWFMLRKKPLKLLKEGSNLKVNFLSKLVTKLTKKLPFNYRFKYSLASRSLGKLFIVSLTSFCTGMLIVLTLIGMNLFNSLIDTSFEGMKYKYMVSYNTAMTEEASDKDDLLLQNSLNLNRLLDEDGNSKKLDEDDYSINLNGIDSDAKNIELLDKNGENIIKKRDEKNGVIINENMREIMDADIGDTLELEYNDKVLSYKIVGVTESYMNFVAYVDRETLSKDFGSPVAIYTTKYSNDSKYSSMKNLDNEEITKISGIFSIEDLENNVRKQMQTMNSSIYIVIGFASFMALVIIAVIANIVVEENKRTISLMKVMGYKNKSISSIVLNIYTPFVIVSYLLSIPAMIALLKRIISLLIGDMNMVIPITLSWQKALIGLIGLLIAYYFAVNLSRKVLNKVPLAVALKRE